jgi:hypothetical protein
MRTINRSTIFGLAAVCSLAAAGSHNPTPPNTAEIAISSPSVPPGQTVQVRFSLTQPMPIGSTGTGFALNGFDTNGIAIWSTNGQACGVGLVQNGVLQFSAVDPSGILGTGADYPFLTLTLTAPTGLAPGTSFPLTWSSDAWLNSPTGPMSLVVKPGKLTIGGSVSIRGIFPGGGTWPAGTLIRIPGSGFQKAMHIQTPIKYSSISIAPNEIDLILKEQTTIDANSFSVLNPDGSSATFFAYMKGAPVRPPSNLLLNSGEYAFPLATQAIATIPATGTLPATQWNALALQNPNPGPAVITVSLEPFGEGRSATFILPPGGRLVDTISGLLNGVPVGPGDSVSMISTAMIQVFGIAGDEAANTLTPFLPGN